jgi:hypothetical protein
MKNLARISLSVAGCMAASALIVHASRNGDQAGSSLQDGPQFTDGHRMLRPDHYREWIYLSSGLGMSYSAGMNMDPQFDNVFVNPTAYRAFIATGKWPDHTVLVLEIRNSQSKGSINQAGRFQGGLEDIEVHVKDSRLPGKWAFFGFGKSDHSAAAIPQSASCYSCHQQHGAVDTTFVQFYPTLLEVARAKGSLNPSY